MNLLLGLSMNTFGKHACHAFVGTLTACALAGAWYLGLVTLFE